MDSPSFSQVLKTPAEASGHSMFAVPSVLLLGSAESKHLILFWILICVSIDSKLRTTAWTPAWCPTVRKLSLVPGQSWDSPHSFPFLGNYVLYVNYEQEIASPSGRGVFHKEEYKANIVRHKRAKAFSTRTSEKSPLHLNWEERHGDGIRRNRGHKQEPDDPRAVTSLVSQVSDSPHPTL